MMTTFAVVAAALRNQKKNVQTAVILFLVSTFVFFTFVKVMFQKNI
jgi:hypothetical protein